MLITFLLRLLLKAAVLAWRLHKDMVRVTLPAGTRSVYLFFLKPGNFVLLAKVFYHCMVGVDTDAYPFVQNLVVGISMKLVGGEEGRGGAKNTVRNFVFDFDFMSTLRHHRKARTNSKPHNI